MRIRTPKKIALAKWPFEKNTYAKLLWIDHPFLKKGRCKLPLLFEDIETKTIEKINVDFGTLSLLNIGKYYKNGNLKKGKYDVVNNNRFKSGIFELSGSQLKCIKGDKKIVKSKEEKYEVFTNKYVGKYKNKEIRIPVIEVLRSILAINNLLLNSLLYPNGLDLYFTIQKNRGGTKRISMHFTKAYKKYLLTQNNIEHLAWLTINKRASRAWNSVYKSVVTTKYEGIYFPFPIDNDFTIKAIYTEQNKIIRIYEIIEVSGKGLDCEEIIVHSPYLKKGKNSNKPKLRKYLATNNDEMEINSDKDGSRKTQDLVEVESVKHRYHKSVRIERVRKKDVKIRTMEDENTEEFEINSDDVVSTADDSFGDVAKGLEYLPYEEVMKLAEGELGQFIKVLKVMQDNYPQIKINYYIGELPKGKRNKKFTYLYDNLTPRKYLMVTIILENKDVVHLLEIERQGKSLSILKLFSNNKITSQELTSIVNNVLIGLVNNNGSWCNKTLDRLYNKGIYNERIRHGRKKRNIKEVANRLYKKI